MPYTEISYNSSFVATHLVVFFVKVPFFIVSKDKMHGRNRTNYPKILIKVVAFNLCNLK